MKIAIPSTGESTSSIVSPSFGRAPYFIFVEVGNKKIKSWEAVKNIYADTFRGAGIATAQLVANEGVSVILVGSIGPNSFFALSQVGIKIYTVPLVTIEKAVEMYLNGEVKEVRAPRGFGGWRRRRW